MEEVRPPDLQPLDPAAFARVWRRVMPADRPDCPFTLPDDDLAPTAPPAGMEVSPLPAPPVPDPLEALCAQAADQYRVYRRLARRTGRLSPLVRQKGRQVKRLAAACFLLTGRPFAPPPTPALENLPLPQALRERFRSEQALSAALLSAAHTAEPWLAQLLQSLAQECQTMARTLLDLLS